MASTEIETISDDMDYAQHNATWHGFTNLVKWSILEMACLVLALYCFIFAGQPWLGGLLILIGVVAPLGAAVRRALR